MQGDKSVLPCRPPTQNPSYSLRVNSEILLHYFKIKTLRLWTRNERKDCAIGWWHFECAGVSKGKWLCSFCIQCTTNICKVQNCGLFVKSGHVCTIVTDIDIRHRNLTITQCKDCPLDPVQP